MDQSTATPLMQQYYTIKKQYKDMLLFFQVGDFYELFFEDAITAARFLGITLTKRGKVAGMDIPLCGVPVHAVEHYIHKLIKGGYKVALCAQLEEATPGVVVKRGVVKVLTPGTLVESHLLDEKSPSYLCVFLPTKTKWGLLFGELMTAQLFLTEIQVQEERLLESELARFFPDEIVVPPAAGKHFTSFFKQLGYMLSVFELSENGQQNQEAFTLWMNEQFCSTTVTHLTNCLALKEALFYFYVYMNKMNRQAINLFKNATIYSPDDFVQIDSKTQKNLELVTNSYDNSRTHTLLEIVDRSVTPMGSRMLKKWIVRPLIKQKAIEQRLQCVERFMHDSQLTRSVTEQLRICADLERAVGRILVSRALIGDFLLLRVALQAVIDIKKLLVDCRLDMPLIDVISTHLVDLTNLKELLENALEDDYSTDLYIKTGYNELLDTMRHLMLHATDQLLMLEKEEQTKTGISSLKIRFNTVHGYYIETTKIASAKIPAHYKPLQSLVGKERYITQDLELLAHRIDRAKVDFNALQQKLFEELKQKVVHHGTDLRKICNAVAHLDALISLATVASSNGYVKPTFNENKNCIVIAGRHPVVEQHITGQFIANDTALTSSHALWIITGPNMGGKSTYLRQVALIAVMAHIGSFVPAVKAEIPLLDRIFTRIGSGDFVAGGKSTFLVEMEETAHICMYATSKSLVILDEVGRGTSTIDGRSIAQAVLEFLAQSNGPLTLFATHYHELTVLHELNSTIDSYYMASKKTETGILFLYQLVKGVADGSFGIEVARLADLPAPIIERAQQICDNALADEAQKMGIVQPVNLAQPQTYTPATHTKIEAAIKAADLDNLTPRQVFELVVRLQEMLSNS